MNDVFGFDFDFRRGVAGRGGCTLYTLSHFEHSLSPAEGEAENSRAAAGRSEGETSPLK